MNRAKLTDIEHLLRLYQLIYGKNYPLAFGTDPEAARKLIESPDDLWLVERDPESGRPIASVVFDVDPVSRIGKIEGLVVHPDFRGARRADKLVAIGTELLLGPEGSVLSIYTTTRTNSVSPQMILLRNGYLPLGIFPNAHKLKDYETLTLLARYRPGVLDRRVPVEAVPEDLGGLLEILRKNLGIVTETRFMPTQKEVEPEPAAIEFELIHAPEFVSQRFLERGGDEYDRFYPFHKPNFMMVSTDGSVEIYAYFSPQDRYCAIVSLNVPVYTLHGRLKGALDQLRERGISYLELLLGLEYGRSIDAAIDSGFLPSAIYPAMRQRPDGQMEDFVVLSRTLEPLNFRGMSVHQAFKPFIDQYVRLWTKKALESLEIYQEQGNKT